MSQLAGAAPNMPGDMRLLVVVGYGGDVLSGQGFGGELRFEGQANAWATIGGGLGAGYRANGNEVTLRKNQPQWIYGARGWGRFNPGMVDWFAATTGIGIAGTDQGTVALTFDASTLFGGAFDIDNVPAGQAFRLGAYGGPAGAISIPLRLGTPLKKTKFLLGFGPDVPTVTTDDVTEYSTTYYWGMQAGLIGDSGRVPAWTGAVELALLVGHTGHETATLFALTTGQGARFKRR